MPVADVDADLHLDVVMLHGHEVWMLQGHGDRSFGAHRELPVRETASAVALGDWNGDLIPDLAVSCAQSSEVSVLLNQLLR